MTEETFQNNAMVVVEALTAYLEECNDQNKPAIEQKPIHEIIDGLNLKELISRGGLTGNTLRQFTNEYLKATTKLHHKHYIQVILGFSLFGSLLRLGLVP